MTTPPDPSPPLPPPPAWGADAGDYIRDAAFVPALAGWVVDRAAVGDGDRVLDVGCGDGTLTERLAATGAHVVGIDADASMVAATRARGIEAHRLDAQRLTDPDALDALGARFDVVVSNAALHWLADLEAAFAGVVHHLRPGGRFVAEAGGFGNVAAVATAARAVLAPHGLTPPAWSFPTAEDAVAMASRAGLVDVAAELVPRPTHVPAGMAAWLRTFLARPLATLGPDAADAVVDEMVALVAPALRTPAGTWWADYVRVRIAGRRPT